MVVILKFVYVIVIFVSLFFMTITVNAIRCKDDAECEESIPAPSGWKSKCIDGNCFHRPIYAPLP
uniref:Late nodulin-like protein n=1 Tax=Astragalus sinicus TaxID=47065 RepID=Q07A34_ASTSI|nr:late nodulin-like protein [Astragalus sinicus]